MASGFMQRFKGRIQAGVIYLGAGGIIDALSGNTIFTASAGGIPKYSVEDGITAFAGGGQTSAYQLTKAISRIATVASANDSVKLPASEVGMEVVVVNDAASNAAKVYGKGTDTIDAVASATGNALAAGKRATYTCYLAGKWVSQVGA